MDELNVIRIPETYTRNELNRRYREIPLSSKQYAPLRKYFNAMANLYGIISLKDAYEIINSQAPTLLSKQQFIYFSEIARHECEDYKILSQNELDFKRPKTPPMEWEIIDASILDQGIGAYKEMALSHRGKPFYIPNKTTFMKYSDAFFCKDTPESIALHNLLVSTCHLDTQTADDIFAELLFSARYIGAALPQVLMRLHDLGVGFDSDADAQVFISIYQAFQHTTRMQRHRGHTPHEIVAMGLPLEHLPTPPKKSVKIGRNELCPCGSGRKYKHCCGR